MRARKLQANNKAAAAEVSRGRFLNKTCELDTKSNRSSFGLKDAASFALTIGPSFHGIYLYASGDSFIASPDNCGCFFDFLLSEFFISRATASKLVYRKTVDFSECFNNLFIDFDIIPFSQAIRMPIVTFSGGEKRHFEF